MTTPAFVCASVRDEAPPEIELGAARYALRGALVESGAGWTVALGEASGANACVAVYARYDSSPGPGQAQQQPNPDSDSDGSDSDATNSALASRAYRARRRERLTALQASVSSLRQELRAKCGNPLLPAAEPGPGEPQRAEPAPGLEAKARANFFRRDLARFRREQMAWLATEKARLREEIARVEGVSRGAQVVWAPNGTQASVTV